MSEIDNLANKFSQAITKLTKNVNDTDKLFDELLGKKETDLLFSQRLENKSKSRKSNIEK